MTKRDIKTLLAASQILHEMNTHGGPYLNRLSAEVRDVVIYAAVPLERVSAKPKEQNHDNRE